MAAFAVAEAHQLARVDGDAVHVGVQLREGLQRERPAGRRGRERHVALHRVDLRRRRQQDSIRAMLPLALSQ